MKVLHVINSLNVGGAERLIAFLLPVFKQYNGIQVDLLVINEGEEILYRELERESIFISVLTSRGLYNPLNIIPMRHYFLKGYDIIHAHLFPTQYIASIAKLTSKTKTKLVFTEHSTSNRRIASPIFSFIDKPIYRLLDHLVCITEEVEELYKNYVPSIKSRISIIPNGIPINQVKEARPHSRNDFKLNSSDVLLLQVAGFRDAKDQDTVIKALTYLPENFKVLFVGDGLRKRSCEKLAKDIGVENRTIFLGVRKDVYNIQKMVDYIILSTHYEGLSLACIEGMASGKPFLASNVQGVQQLVSGAGILFEESNPKDLAQKVLTLDQDKVLKKGTIENCIRRSEEYTIEKMAQRHLELYKKILESD
ncbi:putative glycosyltransferase EpsD [Porphyromonas levii]|uniref:glycosyltransferase n=1 Tax=Porphyromonas levii TaxID=28114 RepID=UPI001BAB47F3|nr:glycosyltransferase [Porphyromonas levii]MBR8784436.1 putative glycosyltransferase EpsD [Porphyromonas levii]